MTAPSVLGELAAAALVRYYLARAACALCHRRSRAGFSPFCDLCLLVIRATAEIHEASA